MTTRRRSDRYVIEVPVWLKDAQGGDHTVTADVSAHGIAVLTTKPRPARQYVELELTLPAPLPKINVTAIVARHIESIESRDGRSSPGLGLDFFLLDSRAKQEWQRFIHILGGEPGVALRHKSGPPLRATPAAQAPGLEPPPRSEPVPAEAVTRGEEEASQGAPTFIIKPRDLGRLWGFFRGEMSKGLVRIETPVRLPAGTPTELLVVHPTTEAEWTLSGRVAGLVEPSSAGQIILEVALEGNLGEARSAFRNFVSTGQGMIEEDVALSGDINDASNLSSPLEREPVNAPSRPVNRVAAGEEAVSVDLGEEVVSVDLDEVAPLGPAEVPEVVDLRAELGEDLASSSITLEEQPRGLHETSSFVSAEEGALDAVEATDLTVAAPLPPLAPAKEATSGSFPGPRASESEALPLEAASNGSGSFAAEGLSGRLFSSFFFEAEASRAEKRAPARPDPSTRPLDLRSVGALPSDANVAETVALLYAPTSDLSVYEHPAILDAPGGSGASSPAVAHLPPEAAARLPSPSGDPAAPTASQAGHPPSTASQAGPRTPSQASHPAQVGSEAEAAKARGSAEGSSPPGPKIDASLARDLAVARSRLMRSPNSITACYRLGTLLMRHEADSLDEALHTLLRVTQLEPNHPGAHHALADVFYRRGELDTAAEHLHRAKRLGYQINPDLERQLAEARAEAHGSRK